MSKNKATHIGTCQCCGSSQKLPGGVLSKHGYTVDWGFFSGVCQGAGYLPFEQSCDLIEKFIKLAKANLAYLIEQKTKWLQPVEGPKAWVQKYRNAHYSNGKGVKGAYYWEEVVISEEVKIIGSGSDAFEYRTFSYPVEKKSYHGDGRIETGFGENAPKTLAEVCAFQNAKYAATFDAKIASARQYIAWQQKRVAEWKPGTLTPLAK